MVVVVAVLAAVVLPANADAAPRQLTASGKLVRGPQLAGARVAWGEGRDGSNRQATVLGGPGVTRRVVYRDRGRSLGALTASSFGLAFDWRRITDGGRSGPQYTSRLRAGPLAGPFSAIRGCPLAGAADLDGALLATAELSDCPNDTGASQVVLRDLATGGQRAIPTTNFCGSSQGARLAGRYVAWCEQSNVRPTILVIVHDLVTGTEAYRIELRETGDLTFDVQADGKLALTYADLALPGRRTRTVLEWYSPAEPRAHRLSQDLRRSGVRITGDRMLVERDRGARSPGERRYELALFDLGGRTASVSRFAAGDRGGTGRRGEFDWDGRRVAYAFQRARLGRVRRGGRTRLRRISGPVVIQAKRPPR